VYSIKEVTYSEWQEHIHNCHKTNMPQFWQYGDAKTSVSKWKAYRFLIANEDGRPIGLVQILLLKLPFFGGIVRINRGPMMIGGFKNHQELIYVFSALFEEFKKRRWFFIQIAPEVNNLDQVSRFLTKFNLKKLSTIPYASGFLSLIPTENQLLMSLKKKWRYSLRKAQGSNINISMLEESNENLEILLKRYNEFKEENEFIGISDSLIFALLKQKKSKEWQFNIFIANTDASISIESCCGILVSIRHGDTTTYFIGISGKVGRDLQVNYLLLWESILHAKSIGCDWFDIGGLNDSTPKGIAHFKNGLKSEPYSLIGEWRGFIFPWKSIKKIDFKGY